MRVVSHTTALCLILAVVSASSAQEQEQQEGQATTTAPEAVQPLTYERQVAAAETIVTRGAALSTRVRGMLNEARKANDIIKTTCLNDKLAQINANLRNAQQRLEELKKAVNPDRQIHEYTVITVLGQKLEVLEQEAGQCVGQDMFETGATNVTTEIDESLVPMDETPSMPPVVLPPSLPTVPPPASGIM